MVLVPDGGEGGLTSVRSAPVRRGPVSCFGLECPILSTIFRTLPIVSDMPRSFPATFPAQTRQLAALGERLREARLRRRITTVQFAERMGVSRDTLNRIERGDATVALGSYLRALRILGLERDLDRLAANDELGRKLQDLELRQKRTRASSGDG